MGKTILLAGASGGIGGALLEELLADPGVGRVFATATKAAASTHPKLVWLELDYARPESIERAAHEVGERADHLDWLICATGYLHGPHGSPEKTLAQVQADQLDAAYRRNASGPLALFAACMPLVKAAEQPRVVFLSAQVGSIDDNRLGGWFGYRMAKAALNMGVKTAAIEAERWRNGTAVVAVHPGTTRSRLSEPFIARRRQPVRSPQETAAKLVRLIGALDASANGNFVTADGAPLPW